MSRIPNTTERVLTPVEPGLFDAALRRKRRLAGVALAGVPLAAAWCFAYVEPALLKWALLGSLGLTAVRAVVGLRDPLRTEVDTSIELVSEILANRGLPIPPDETPLGARVRLLEALEIAEGREGDRRAVVWGRLAYGVGLGGWGAGAVYAVASGEWELLPAVLLGVCLFGGMGVLMEVLVSRGRRAGEYVKRQLRDIDAGRPRVALNPLDP